MPIAILVSKTKKMETIFTQKIFLVDDDAFSREIYLQHLHNMGCTNVQVFENGTACLDALTEEPRVIFLDHRMDILNGVDVLKKIKRFNPNIFVIFLSGQDNIRVAVNSLKYGAFDYIVKGDQEARSMEQCLLKIQELQQYTQRNKKHILQKIFSVI
jgi:polysaccharide export outer membrane protein